jgi:complement component 1 Q subcomponent-binding protein
MLSLRAFTRSAPRAFTRSFSVAARPASRLPSAFSRQTSLQTSLTKYQYSAFSTARVLREPAGDSDVELSAKLEEEISYEKNNASVDEASEAIKAYLQSSPWKVKDVAGEQDIVLTRKFGNENIRATFAISDLQNVAEEFDDLAESDFDEHAPANQAQPGQAVGVHPEDQVSPADDGFHEDPQQNMPIHVNITIEKPGNGALFIQTTAQDGTFEILEVSHFANAELASGETAEKDWLRHTQYSGPVFNGLDEDLKSMFDRYLEERGFNTELANIIPEYLTAKEQAEYSRWLGNLKSFVSA